MPPPLIYKYSVDGGPEEGPVTLHELRQMLASGALPVHTRVCRDGTTIWRPIQTVLGRSAPAIQPVHTDLVDEDESEKRILPAFLLCFFLGGIAAHAFYAGRGDQGAIYIILWVLVICTRPFTEFFYLVPLLAIAVFGLSDLVRIVIGVYTDGDGKKITQWT